MGSEKWYICTCWRTLGHATAPWLYLDWWSLVAQKGMVLGSRTLETQIISKQFFLNKKAHNWRLFILMGDLISVEFIIFHFQKLHYGRTEKNDSTCHSLSFFYFVL